MHRQAGSKTNRPSQRVNRRAALAATLAALAATASAASAAENPTTLAPGIAGTTVAALPGAGQALTAYGGWVVWSTKDAGGAWRLTALHDGQVTQLAVAQRSSPFDADAGPDAQGRPTLVYSRCTRGPTGPNTAPVPDWATARGCRLYALTLGRGHERRLGGVLTGGRTDSNYAPSIWGRQIAFSRLVGGTHTAQILLYRPGARLRRLAGGTPPCVHTVTTCSVSKAHAGALAMDLGPHVLALSWLIRAPNVTGIADGTELRSVPLDGRPSALAESGLFSGTCGYRTPNSPTAAGTSVAYLLDTGGDDCATDSATFQLFSATGAHQVAPVAPGLLPVAAARDGAATYWINEIEPAVPGYYGYSDCVTAPTACSLMRSDSIPYQTSPPRRVLPPTY